MVATPTQELLTTQDYKLDKGFSITFLKFCKKYLLKYHERQLSVGNTPTQAITEGMEVFRLLKLR